VSEATAASDLLHRVLLKHEKIIEFF